MTEPSSQLRQRFLSDANLNVAEALTQFALQRGHSLLALAFAWLVAHAEVSSVIAGATSAAQIQAKCSCVGLAAQR